MFNLKDPQSQFGDWISLFLKAALMAEGTAYIMTPEKEGGGTPL